MELRKNGIRWYGIYFWCGYVGPMEKIVRGLFLLKEVDPFYLNALNFKYLLKWLVIGEYGIRKSSYYRPVVKWWIRNYACSRVRHQAFVHFSSRYGSTTVFWRVGCLLWVASSSPKLGLPSSLKYVLRPSRWLGVVAAIFIKTSWQTVSLLLSKRK